MRFRRKGLWNINALKNINIQKAASTLNFFFRNTFSSLTVCETKWGECGGALGPQGNSRDSSGLEQTKGNMHVSTNPGWKQQSTRQTKRTNVSQCSKKLCGNVLDVLEYLCVFYMFWMNVWLYFVVFGYSRPLCQLHETGCQSGLSIFGEVCRITGIHGASWELHLPKTKIILSRTNTFWYPENTDIWSVYFVCSDQGPYRCFVKLIKHLFWDIFLES